MAVVGETPGRRVVSRGWTLPAALTLLATAGLVAGLLADGAWDWAASGALLLPLGTAWWSGRR